MEDFEMDWDWDTNDLEEMGNRPANEGEGVEEEEVEEEEVEEEEVEEEVEDGGDEQIDPFDGGWGRRGFEDW